MDTGELRKRILRALEEGGKDSRDLRQKRDDAARAYDVFLETIAIPLVRQSADVLRAEAHEFAVNTPASRVQLVSETSAATFLEFVFDHKGARAQVLGRVSTDRGHDVVLEEIPIAAGKSIPEITEDDIARFLIGQIPKLVR